MTNLEGRVLRRRQALRRPPGVRTDLECWRSSPTGWAAGSSSTTDPRAVFDELRRASAGGIADYAGITYERIEAEQGVFWPCPDEDHPGTPRLFADALPHPRRAGPVHPGRAPRAGRGAGPRVPVRADHRPDDAALPERHPDPAGRARCTMAAARRRASSCTPTWPAGTASPTATWCELRTPPRPRGRSGPGSPTASGRTPCSRRSTGAATPARTRSPTRRLDRHSRMPAFKACAVAVARVGEPTGAPPPPTRTADRRRDCTCTAPHVPAGRLRLRGQGPGPARRARRRLSYTVPDRRRSPRRSTSAAATAPTS